MSPADRDRAELHALTRALRAHLRRRRSAGQRLTRVRVPVPEPDRVPVPAADRVPVPVTDPAPSEPTPRTEPATLETRAAGIRRLAAAAPDLETLRSAVAECTACELCKSRTQTVFADGAGARRVMFIGEAPGFHEDREGVPFVGPAGRLLTDIIERGMGIPRSEVTIANVLKCRPPDNRDPTRDEKTLCTGWLDRQIELVDPLVLIALGRHAAGHLLASEASMGKMRGKVHERAGRKVVATYHPAFLLRSPEMKKECWKDIQLAMRELGLARPGEARESGKPR